MINLEELKSKNIHIVGLSGTEGAQLALFLHAKGCVNLIAHDFCEEEKFRENFMMFHGALEIEDRKNYFEKVDSLKIKKCFKSDYLEGIEKADLIFVSQGWYLYEFNKPKLFELKDKGVPFYTILNLYLSICKAKTIGITGSNGKTTTSRLIWEILKKWSAVSDQWSVLYVGNDRNAVQDLFGVENLTKDDFLVLEISNRQLKLIQDQSPNIGIITNITENHMNEHESFESYAYQKSKVWRFQKEGDYAILNMDDEVSRQCLDKIDVNGNVILFCTHVETIHESSLRVPIQYVYIKNNQIFVNDEYIMDVSDIKIPGKHNIENVLAAVAATYFAGIKPEIIREAIADFRGVEKRLQFIGEVDGIKFYNDLSSTTPTSTIAAIRAFENASSITLILGGDDKNLKYEDLVKVIDEKVDTLILMEGTVKEKVNSSLPLSLIAVEDKPFKKRGVFETDTILEAFQIAKENTKKGGVALLSPAGEGFFTKFLNRRTGGMSLEKALSEIKK